MGLKLKINDHLNFIANFVNKKFGFLVPNYQLAYDLISQCLPTKQIFASDLYYHFLLKQLGSKLTFKSIDHDLGLNLKIDQVTDQEALLILDHFGGNPANLDLIQTGQVIVEDISFSLGSRWKNKNIGSFGLISLLTLGTNLDLLRLKPKLINLQTAASYFKIQSPVVILTKKFSLRQKISLFIKRQAVVSDEAYTSAVLFQLEQIGEFIQNLNDYKTKNDLEVRRIYRQHKDKSLPDIHQNSQPYFSFIAQGQNL